MTSWLISANRKTYNHAGAFERWGFIDWRQHTNYQVGDIVYIYCSYPDSAIRYKTEVIKPNMHASETVDDSEFWEGDYSKNDTKIYARLKLLESIDGSILSLEHLKAHGLKNAPQMAMRVKDDLLAFVENGFSEGKKPDINTEIEPTLVIQSDDIPLVVCPTCGETFKKASRCPVCGQKIKYESGKWNKPKLANINEWIEKTVIEGVSTKEVADFVESVCVYDRVSYHIGAVDLTSNYLYTAGAVISM